MPKDQQRVKRANGEASRRRILDAAVEIAGERGYEGTTMSLVRERCGLPSSSIYWHFKNKDDLLAAVIERSFATMLETIDLPEGDDAAERGTTFALHVAKALLESPDFLRLGLMLALEKRPEEPCARRKFLEVRHIAFARVADHLHALAPTADAAAVRLVATYALAGVDGLFIAREIGGDSVDLVALFELHARLVLDAATELSTVIDVDVSSGRFQA